MNQRELCFERAKRYAVILSKYDFDISSSNWGRTKNVIERRAEGITLEQIAEEYNISRERVREIESAGHAKIRYSKKLSDFDKKWLYEVW